MKKSPKNDAHYSVNYSYTMIAKPMKTLELHYPVIQVLIINNTEP